MTDDMISDQQLLSRLAEGELGVTVETVSVIRAHASARRIYRLVFQDKTTVIGVVNDNLAENRAFVCFSRGFTDCGLNVPQILASDEACAYLQTDFGDRTLMDVVKSSSSAEISVIEAYYQRALDHLLQFQIKGLGALDRSMCYQGDIFQGQAVQHDIEYFCRESSLP